MLCQDDYKSLLFVCVSFANTIYDLPLRTAALKDRAEQPTSNYIKPIAGILLVTFGAQRGAPEAIKNTLPQNV